ncbi:hypothetical protein [Bacillus sp. FJAT-29814]|uniref:hypothetical protein n=1 Tax=Bacillus sp. FJAT-29814 TaxID=1729688 RepID=UPI0008304396|nr:hypothetical protein [Bacillus sp. FJAT-29814]
MGKKKKSKPIAQEDFGSVEFHCLKCDSTFEVKWETIWDIQECKHGYVGYDLNDTLIWCEKCGELINEHEEPVPVIMSIKQITDEKKI